MLEPLAQKKPSVPGVETLLGRAYFTSKTYQQAILHLQLATEQAPEDWESIQLLALSYYALGKVPGNRAAAGKSQPSPAAGPGGCPLYSRCLLRTAQQWENARKAFAGMFGVSPESPMAHLMLAKMLVRLQLEDQAPP